jgi:hypothetical protein
MGNTFDAFTGGWVFKTSNAQKGENTANGLYAKANSATGAYYWAWQTVNTIDLTAYTKLKAVVVSDKTMSNDDGMFRVGVTSNATAITNWDGGGLFTQKATAGVELEAEFDLSGITGNRYVRIAYQGGRSAVCYIRKVWFE